VVHRGEWHLPVASLTASKEQIDMADPFLGQIEAFAFTYAPVNWAICAGQLLSISHNQALFSLLGTNFGGDGRSTFALPDLRGRVATGVGQEPGRPAYSLGQKGGEEMHAISQPEMPAAPPHLHRINAIANDTNSGVSAPGSNVMLGRGYKPVTGTPAVPFYSTGTAAPTIQMTPTGVTGGGASHENRMPYAVLTYYICTAGLFPDRG
jgi:microcystin-dependent protein